MEWKFEKSVCECSILSYGLALYTQNQEKKSFYLTNSERKFSTKWFVEVGQNRDNSRTHVL